MSDSDSEPEMAIRVSSIRTLQDLYKAGAIRAARSPKYLTKRPSGPCIAVGIPSRQGDITALEVDSIVNAANSHLGGGAGGESQVGELVATRVFLVNGAIQRAAGGTPGRMLTLGGCETGFAKITRGYRLPAKHVIHAVGPIYSSRNREKSGRAAVLLQDQPRNCRSERTQAHRTPAPVTFCVSVADEARLGIPFLIYWHLRYPIDDATHIALDATRVFLDTPDGEKVNQLDRVIFVVGATGTEMHLIPHYFPQEEELSPSEKPQDEQVKMGKLKTNHSRRTTKDEPARGEPTKDEPARDEPDSR
ncbi:A1pp-domain-containing protein [Thelephora terrestris]|uniref:A1pp-domain-containing protein n=1 Tax=Thelephora terrestris TaxID=56493 RepID=A0A9P6H1E3_9AGAM|nr:A1pp-domain-containing protein [Thelephora terrestris]